MRKIIVICILAVFSCMLSGQAYRFPLGEYEELADGKPHDGKEVWEKEPAATQFAWGSTNVRYQKLNVPKVAKTRHWQAKAWKGERVNAQAVLWTSADLKDVNIKVSDLENGSKVIPSSAVKTNFVRYVMTDELSKDGRSGCGRRPDKSVWDSTLVADVLDINAFLDVKAYTSQPVWVNIWVPQDARPGKYKGTLTVSGSNMEAMELQMEVEVLDHILPAPKDWKIHIDFWQNPYSVARYYQVPLWSREHFDAMRPLFKMLADAGQKVVTATIMHKPWGGQTFDHFDSMVVKTKKIDGTWEYDYTVFDKWIGFMMDEVGIDNQINCYTMIPWALQFDYLDQATGRVLYVNASPGDEIYSEYWSAFLKDFASHLKQKGWFGKTTISMDERRLEHMQAAIKLIKDADPDFKISLAGNFYPEIQADLYDLSLAYGNRFPEEVKTERGKAGKISTVYTCCAEPLPNIFTFSPPAEASWTMWHSAAGNYDGYLRWAWNSWVEEPLLDSRFRSFAAGDCFQVYPGPRSSIRWEKMVEGIQDAEKIRILREEFAAKGQKNKLKKLNNTVSQFTAENLNTGNAGEMVDEARKVLNGF